MTREDQEIEAAESEAQDRPAAPSCPPLTVDECADIADILGRRANDVATFEGDVKGWTGGTFREFPGSVEMALTREVTRLRGLERRVREVGKANAPGMQPQVGTVS